MLLLAAPLLAKYTPHPSGEPKTLAIVLVGHNLASETYVGIKVQKAAGYGVNAMVHRLDDTVSQSQIKELIDVLNRDPSVDGIIVQLPLPPTIETEAILDAIKPQKDVDNLTGKSHLSSPMVQAVSGLINEYAIDLTGKTACVIGRGRLVGLPITAWLKSIGISPEIVTRQTPNPDDVIRTADLVITGAGTDNIINASNVRPGQVIIDCSGHDVDVEAVEPIVAAVTPRRGGIGPLTVHFLLTNVLKTKSAG